MESLSSKTEKGPIHPDYKRVYREIEPQVMAAVKNNQEAPVSKTDDRPYRERMKELNDAFAGSGTNANAYSVAINGHELIAKVGKSGRMVGGIGVLMSARGIPHVPQLVAYSDDETVVVMTKMPGLDPYDYRDRQIPVPEYTDQQVEELLNTAILLENRGIEIDPKPSNFLYDPKEGFSIIDFPRRKREELKPTQPHEKSFRWIGRVLQNFVTKLDVQESLPEREQIIEEFKIRLDAKIRFTTLVQNHFPQIWQGWKNAQGTKEGFLWQSLSDLPDEPELNSRFEKLEELGVAWDDKREGGIRSQGVEAIIEQRRDSERLDRERAASLAENKGQNRDDWGTIPT